MAKTYFEKLKDPRWQKKRLEALEKSAWTCVSCGDSTKTLHVHHKQYIKGREPWEYDTGQLTVLCESCHKESHDDEDLLNVVSSYAPISGLRQRTSCASLLAGFIGLPMTNDLVEDPESFVYGEVVAVLQQKAVSITGLIDWLKSSDRNMADLTEILTNPPKPGDL